jgi:bla regulator protein blaR1
MNIFTSIFSEEFIRAFAWTLIHSLWQGGLLALIAAGLLFLLRKHSPSIRYIAFCLIMLMLPVLFAGTFLVYINQEKRSTEAHAVANYATERQEAIAMVANAEVEQPGNWVASSSHLINSKAKFFFMLWFMGFIFFLVRFAGSLFFIFRLKNKHLYEVDLAWEQKLEELASNIGLNRQVRLAESALARIPLTIGYIKPVILLPLGTLTGVPPQQIDAILLHELAHILRKDYLVNLMQSFVEIMFFYHPATWWISGLIRQEREHICDDLAISIHHDHINYIKALTTMEELNLKSLLLANAMGGSQKQLLARVKRLVTPVKLRKGISDGVLAFIVIIGLVFALSFNALSDIPSSYDLTGRESGERVFNLINPVSVSDKIIAATNPGEPDSIVSTSKSGKVIVKVYTDSIDADNEKYVRVFAETLDDNLNDTDKPIKEYSKQIIVINDKDEEQDSLREVIIVKSGDSIKIFKNDTLLVFPDGYDTTITTDNGFMFYGFDIPEIPNIPELRDMPDVKYYYFDDDQKMAREEFQWQLMEQELDMKEFESQQKDLKEEMEKNVIIIENPEDIPNEWKWTQPAPEPQIKQSERIFRQELWDDGLTEKGRKYVIEIDSKAMYINGEKQSREIYKKYRKLAESLENVPFDEGDTFKMIF